MIDPANINTSTAPRTIQIRGSREGRGTSGISNVVINCKAVMSLREPPLLVLAGFAVLSWLLSRVSKREHLRLLSLHLLR